MIRKPSKSSGTGKGSKRRNDLLSSLSDAEEEEEDLGFEVDDMMIQTLGKTLMTMNIDGTDENAGKFKMDFERWLESTQDNQSRETDISTNTKTLSTDFPVPVPASSQVNPSITLNTSLKFDDDFGPFQSIPSQSASPSSPLHRPILNQTSNATAKDEGKEEVEDIDLPTRAEIIETSRLLFPHLTSSRLSQPSTSSDPPNTSLPATNEASQTSPSPNTASAPPKETETETDSAGPEHLDLTSIFSSLQSMKSEIASMPNADDRRKAAARVALGLVWALEGDSWGIPVCEFLRIKWRAEIIFRMVYLDRLL